MPSTKFTKYCSIDGDADRLIYFFHDQNERFRLLDGDRFSVLYASFLSMKLKEANLFDDIQMGVVQTAYANGSSTNYLLQTMVNTILLTMNFIEQQNSRMFP
jgi:phosphoacetylglucosamine mutase